MKYILSICFVLSIYCLQAQTVPNGTLLADPTATVIDMPVAHNSAAKINYVRTWEPWRPVSNKTLVPTLPVAEVKQTTNYIDGLGRSIQTVTKQISPLGKDLADYTVLDEYGRETLEYLPYTSSGTDGYFKTNPFAEQKMYYTYPSLNNNQYGGEQVFYGRNVFEASPLNRTKKMMAPGNSWAGSDKGVTTEYRNNTAADAVRIWTVSAALGSVPVTSAIYPGGSLSKTITTDEDNKITIEYSDNDDKVILKKVQTSTIPGAAHTGWLCTYYIYDDFDQLRCVIQPRAIELMVGTSEDGGIGTANWTLTSTLLDEQCFRYEYDYRNRQIIKKVPGAGEVHMVYDALDRLIMTQDANQRNLGKWMATQYDNLDRPVATGIMTSSSDRATHQLAALNSTNYPTNISEELTHTWYDNYNYPGAKSFDTPDIGKLSAGMNPYPDVVQKTDQVYGKVTGTKTKVLGTNQYLLTTIYYDDRGRALQTLADNYLGGLDIITNRYDFTGKVLSAYLKHTNPSGTPSSIRILTKMLYDHAGRLVKTWKQLNDDGFDKLIAENSYDELGQLKSRKLAPAYNSGAGLESLDYKYNIRGWQESLNKDFADATNNTHWFGQVLHYDYGMSKKYYNGNISGARWRSRGDGEQRAYGFDYDNNNRLLKADFTQNTSGWNTSAGVDFSVKMGDGSNAESAYDANGNILQMQQWGLKIGASSQIDNLHYHYYPSSNRLLNVIDDQNDINTKLGDFRTPDTHPNYGYTGIDRWDYMYDDNGNLTADLNKGLGDDGGGGIEYNLLNLPSQMNLPSKGVIIYYYDALGTKLRKVTTDNTLSPAKITTTDYVGGLVYENNVLQFSSMEEGRIRYKPAEGQTAANFQYDYFIKDHLGNVRMVLTEEQKLDKYPVATMEDAKIATEDNYYTVDNSRVVAASSLTQSPPAYTNDNGIGNNPTDVPFETTNSAKLYKLNATTNKTGLGITLKVMAGDRIDIHGASYWYEANTGGSSANSAPAVIDLLAGLLGSPAGVASGKATASQLDAITAVNSPLAGFISQPGRQNSSYPERPKAFINYVFLDEQFKMAGGGFSAVKADGGLKLDHFAELQNKIAPKNGYVYIYVSNESPVNVFFDNLQVVHTRGPILEETHYYPFGLTMSKISSSAVSFGQPNNKKKYNGIDKEDDLQIDIYDAQLRELDQQIGRWWQVDPKTENMEMWSPYTSNYDNPITYMDILGDEPSCCEWLTNLLASGSGAVNGFLHTATGGLYPYDPFDVRSRLSDEARMYYDNAATVGGYATLLGPRGVKGGSGPRTAPVLVTPGGRTFTAPVASPAPPLTPPVASPNGGQKGNTQANSSQANQTKASQTKANQTKANSAGNADSEKDFGGQKDTESKTAREAFRKAKEQNGIPRSQQPEKTYTTPDKHTGEPLKTYEFKNSRGKKIVIRRDKPIKYPDGGSQGDHFNAGDPSQNNGKLKQHHDIKK